MDMPTLKLDDAAGRPVLRLGGAFVTENLGSVEKVMSSVAVKDAAVELDMSGLTALDTGGAWAIIDLQNRLQHGQTEVEITGAATHYAALLQTVSENLFPEEVQAEPDHGVSAWFSNIGETVVDAGKGIAAFCGFFGLVLHRLGRSILQPRRIRWASLVSQMEEAGLNAVPVVALMGFLIGVVLAFQGAAQLQQFGAEVYVVELISISVLRELGIMLTAIIVAGRSGSAFTAAIGSMKVQEEIDAMQTLGLDPIEVLVLPRLLALLIMLPILGLIANFAGLFGGMLMSWIELGVSPNLFLTRLQDNTDVWNLLVGLIKAPFFAVVISVVACRQAMLVGGSAASVGQRTTASVVQSIFLVIAIDALFSIFFSELGV